MKNLIIYYSRRGQNYVNGSIKHLDRGNAELITEFIKNAVGADVFEVDTVKPYDTDYMVCIEEAKAELRAKARPELKEYLDDISEYDNIFVVGPNWWGIYPMAMYTQLERLDFTGKTVHCYEVTFVNPAKQPKVQIYNCAKYQRYVKGAERKQSRGLAILLYVDWLPQANGFAASSIIYRRGSLLQKNCLVPT